MIDLFGSETKTMLKDAEVSPCGLYRYSLTRIWDKAQPLVSWIMLNPSTADASVDDPTIRRVIGFTRSWGYGGFVVRNLFPLRATDPKELDSHQYPFGPAENRMVSGELLDALMNYPLIVCAWGSKVPFRRDWEFMEVAAANGKTLHCLRLSKGGMPCHPLYMPADLQPILFREGKV